VREVYLDDDEYAALQEFLMQNPEAGKVVPGSGGVRKLRWRHGSSGKRGGLRVLYFVRHQPNEFWIYRSMPKQNRKTHRGIFSRN
jgi:hypothetical protein